MRASSPVEQKTKVCVVATVLGVHMFAFMMVFCFIQSEVLLRSRS